ncbi:MAG TPA: SRPBCC family protein [Byssovorax sp.]|jgi:ribosome-associated toxin RatA of RatAB toxin-antitoxin module
MNPRSTLLALAAAAAVAAPGLAGAEGGDVEVKTVAVAGSDTPKIVMTGTMDAPPEKVWAIVSDCSKYKERMPRIAAARELARAGNTRTCEVTIEMPFPLSNLTAVTLATHTEAPPHFVRAWKLVRGDYKVNDGSWDVTAAPGGKSKVTYSVHAEPNTAVPGWVRERAQKSALPDMFARVAAEAKKVP